jgi:hypothetical protein
MKVFFVGLLVVLSSADALYYGTPGISTGSTEGVIFEKDALLGIKIGYLGDITLNKSLMPSQKVKALSVESFTSQREQGVILLNFINRFEVYSSLGAMQLKIEPKISKTLAQLLSTSNQFTWGVGGRAVLFDYNKIALGLDMKYQSYSPHLLYAHDNGAPVSLQQNAKLRYREWQAGLGLSYETLYFSPYIGAIYNQTSMRFMDLKTQKSHLFIHSRKKFGAAVGVMISSGKDFELDLEARMINERAFSASGNFRF